MAKLLAVEPRPPARSPERERLKAAVAALSEAEAARARVESARAKLPDTVDLIGMIDRAQEALADARKRRSRWLTDRLLGEASGEEDPFTVAEAELRSAEAALDQAREQHTIVGQRGAEINTAIMMKQAAVKNAVADVLRADPAVARLAYELRATQARVVHLWKCMRAISRRGGIPDSCRLWANERGHPDLIPADASMTNLIAWEAALAALETGDADVALPELPVTNEHVSTDTPPPRSAA